MTWFDDELTPYCVARWRLAGATLPAIEETIEVGALTRRALMGQARRLYGKRNLPGALSGHGPPRRARHEHIFCLPEDADGDGRIDHITAYCRAGFGNRTLRCLVELEHLWAGRWGEWQVVEHRVAEAGEQLGTLAGRARTWFSATPFVAPRHFKVHHDAVAQIYWQCRQMGLPKPVEVSRFEGTAAASLPRASAFRLRRFGQDAGPPVPHATNWRLDFAGPVPGPVALGYGCHFGLGTFRRPHDEP